MIWAELFLRRSSFTPGSKSSQVQHFGIVSLHNMPNKQQPIQWNNNSKVTAGSERLSDLLEVTEEEPPHLHSDSKTFCFPTGFLSRLRQTFCKLPMSCKGSQAVQTWLWILFSPPCDQNKALFRKHKILLTPKV